MLKTKKQEIARAVFDCISSHLDDCVCDNTILQDVAFPLNTESWMENISQHQKDREEQKSSSCPISIAGTYFDTEISRLFEHFQAVIGDKCPCTEVLDE